MNWIIKKIVGSLFDSKNSEFWAGPVNILVQGCLRLVGWMIPETKVAEFGESMSNWLALMLPYAAGRVLSKLAKPT